MKNKLEKSIVAVSATVLTLFAKRTSASACTLSFYQPEEPKCLGQK